MDECVCGFYTWPENSPPVTLNAALTVCTLQNANFQALSFSMNAQACSLAAANWIRISGGFYSSWRHPEPRISPLQLSVMGMFLLLTLHVSLLTADVC